MQKLAIDVKELVVQEVLRQPFTHDGYCIEKQMSVIFGRLA